MRLSVFKNVKSFISGFLLNTRLQILVHVSRADDFKLSLALEIRETMGRVLTPWGDRTVNQARFVVCPGLRLRPHQIHDNHMCEIKTISNLGIEFLFKKTFTRVSFPGLGDSLTFVWVLKCGFFL
jgi:hypothetical protein